LSVPVKVPPRRRRHRRAIIISIISLLVAAGATVGGLLLFDKTGPFVDVSALAVSPDGNLIAAAYVVGNSDEIDIWHATASQLVGTLRDNSLGFVGGLAFSPDSKTIVAESDAGITIWNVGTKKLTATIAVPPASDSCFALSPDGKLLAICGPPTTTDQATTSYAYIVDLTRGRISATLRVTDSACQTSSWEASFSPDGKTLAVSAGTCKNAGTANGTYSTTVQLWNIKARRIVHTIPMPAYLAGYDGYALGYSRDSGMLVVGDNLVSLRTPVSTQKILGASGHAAAFSPDGRMLAVADTDSTNNKITIWNFTENQEVSLLADPRLRKIDSIENLAYTPDGKMLVTSSEYSGSNIYLWDIASRSISATLSRSGS